MGIIYRAVAVALAAVVIALVDWMLLWNFDIPGSGWLTLLIGAIPISMAVAVRREAGAGAST